MDPAWTLTELNRTAITHHPTYVPAENVDNPLDIHSKSQNEGDGALTQDSPEQPCNPRRKRGRVAKDPLNETISFQCRGAEESESMLRDFLKSSSSIPERTTLEFKFPISTAFMVYPQGHSQATKDPVKRVFSRIAISVVDALEPALNPKDQLEKQRSIAKVCVEAVSKADGFKYSFNNHWMSKEDRASRFSFFCNDSTLNKARAGNPAASKRVAHKRAQKPVYSCEGTISIKFSVTKQLLEVYYKHIPCHDTYAARAPIPRKGTRRRLMMEMFEPEKLPAPRTSVTKQPKPEKQRAKDKSKTDGMASPGNLEGPLVPMALGQGRQNSAVTDLQHADVVMVKAPAAPKAGLQNKILADQTKDLHNIPTKSNTISKKRVSQISRERSPLGRSDEERPLQRQKMTRARISEQDLHEKNAISVESNSNKTSQPAIPITAASQLSEIDILKAKLLHAEQRIKELEAEKSLSTHASSSAHITAQNVYPSASSDRHQNRYHPPTQHFQTLYGYEYPYSQPVPLRPDRASVTGSAAASYSPFGVLKVLKTAPQTSGYQLTSHSCVGKATESSTNIAKEPSDTR